MDDYETFKGRSVYNDMESNGMISIFLKKQIIKQHYIWSYLYLKRYILCTGALTENFWKDTQETTGMVISGKDNWRNR